MGFSSPDISSSAVWIPTADPNGVRLTYFTVSKLADIELRLRAFTDADCGRGFTRLADQCVAVTTETMEESQVAATCSSVGAAPFKTTSASLFHQVRMHVKNKGIGMAWSDFKSGGSGSGADAYQNADSQLPSQLGITAASGFKPGANMAGACTVFDSSDADFLLSGVPCSGPAASAVCIKPGICN